MKPEFDWNETFEHVGKSAFVGAFVGVAAALIMTTLFWNYPENHYFTTSAEITSGFHSKIDISNSAMDTFFGYGIVGFGVTTAIGSLSFILVVMPIRWIVYLWPTWLTVTYWMFISNPHAINASYFEMQEALKHLPDKPEQAKICIQRAMTGFVYSNEK